MKLLNTVNSSIAAPVYPFEPHYFMRLSVQTNPDNAIHDALYRAIQWRHKRAKSFTIHGFCHVDYYGYPQDRPTGYAEFTVVYYSTAKEGMFKVPANFEDNWKHEFDLLACLGIEVI